MNNGLMALAAGMAVLVGLGAGLGCGLSTGKATESIARQPEAAGKITTALLIGNAFAEATAVYGLLVAIMILGKIV